jgi:hypothetical protein
MANGRGGRARFHQRGGFHNREQIWRRKGAASMHFTAQVSRNFWLTGNCSDAVSGNVRMKHDQSHSFII